MTRSDAIARIQRGLGFRQGLTNAIISALQEAQRELEKGKTLPKFLLQEDQALTLISGTHTVAIPDGFIREYDDEPLRYLPLGSQEYTVLPRKIYSAALAANFESNETSGPKIYVLRSTTIDFITTANQDYDLLWTYYARADVLDSDIENAWLADTHGPEWLIGEAGWRIASDLRDTTAASIFDNMRKTMRASVLGEIIDLELSGGPMFMGSNL